MRFATLQDAKQYMIDNLGYRDAQAVVDKAKSWVKRKRLMFSPTEFQALKNWVRTNDDLELARIHHLIDELESRAKVGVFIVVEASIRTQANDIALKLDPIGGDQTFTTRLSPSGNPPATHYWCHWHMPRSWYDHIKERVLGNSRVSLYLDSGWTAEEVLNDMGLKVIEDELVIVAREKRNILARAWGYLKRKVLFWRRGKS